jgi:hypothetical protein
MSPNECKDELDGLRVSFWLGIYMDYYILSSRVLGIIVH